MPIWLRRFTFETLKEHYEKINKDKLNRQHKFCIEKLTINLANSRFQKIINCYRRL